MGHDGSVMAGHEYLQRSAREKLDEHVRAALRTVPAEDARDLCVLEAALLTALANAQGTPPLSRQDVYARRTESGDIEARVLYRVEGRRYTRYYKDRDLRAMLG